MGGDPERPRALQRWLTPAATAAALGFLLLTLINASWLAPEPKGAVKLVAHRGVSQLFDQRGDRLVQQLPVGRQRLVVPVPTVDREVGQEGVVASDHLHELVHGAAPTRAARGQSASSARSR